MSGQDASHDLSDLIDVAYIELFINVLFAVRYLYTRTLSVTILVNILTLAGLARPARILEQDDVGI